MMGYDDDDDTHGLQVFHVMMQEASGFSEWYSVDDVPR